MDENPLMQADFAKLYTSPLKSCLFLCDLVANIAFFGFIAFAFTRWGAMSESQSMLLVLLSMSALAVTLNTFHHWRSMRKLIKSGEITSVQAASRIGEHALSMWSAAMFAVFIGLVGVLVIGK